MKSLTPIQIRVAFYVLSAGLILALFFLWLNGRDEKLRTKSNLEQSVRTGQAATGIAQDASQARVDTAQDESAVYSARDTYQRGYEDAKRDDPTVLPWGSRPVPQRLRDLARERRLQRERSGCAGDGCGRDDGASGREPETAGERDRY